MLSRIEVTGKSPITVLTHTHSECKDVFVIYNDFMQDYVFSGEFFGNTHHLILTNNNDEVADAGDHSVVVYDESLPFSERLKLGLEHVDTEYVLFMLEDYIPYGFADELFFDYAMKYMEDNKKIGFIRLLQSGAEYDYNYGDEFNELYVIKKSSPYFFSTQATIWRTSVLRELVEKTTFQRPQSELEASDVLREMPYIGLCTTRKGNSVGGHHDSAVLPYIATAIRGGKWNMSEYPLIKSILLLYQGWLSIFPVRGTI